jgi:cytochrome P450
MSAMDYEAVDFLQRNPLHQDPYPYFEYIRSKGPVYREPRRGVLMVTGHAECSEVYRDTATYSSAALMAGPFAQWPVPLEGDDISEIIEKYRDTLPLSDQIVTFDPPKHTAHRSLLGRLLTPKRLKENEDFLWRIAADTIEKFIAQGKCDMIHDFANPFALVAVADLLGVPATFHDELLRNLQHKAAPTQQGSDRTKVQHKPLEYLYATFGSFIEDRRREPRNDVLTSLASATFPDGTLPTVQDVTALASGLFAAGHETTVRLIGYMFQALGEDAELQKTLRDKRELLPTFIEESLRLSCPIQADFRLARRKTTLAGIDVAAGTSVMVIPAAANRDPRKFENPNEIRLDRANARHHLSFGSGIHSCAGAPLARTEARIAGELLLDRMGDIRISEEHHGPANERRWSHPQTFIVHGVEHLHLEFQPLAAPARERTA